MTEYDYSPEAFERHIHKQQAISKWVQKTNQGPMRNPFTPATPAPLENDLDDSSDQDDPRRHRRGQSYDQYDRHRDRDFDRHEDRDRDRGVSDRDRHKDKPRSLHYASRPPNTKRHRSASQSATVQSVPKSYNVPPPLPIPPPWQMPYSQKPSPLGNNPAPYPQYYPPKLTSPRDSRRSSHSSSTTRIHSPNSYFPPQTSPYGSSTNYKHSPEAKYGYGQPVPLRDGRIPDFTNAPQYPYSMYEVKQPTLFKRLFKGLTGGNKQPPPQRVPRRKRSSSL